MLHKYVEIAAAKTNITYELHEVEFNTLEKIAVVKCVANINNEKQLLLMAKQVQEIVKIITLLLWQKKEQ